jgi:hypothetical protein
VIHDNFIQGAYPYDPATDPYNGGGFATDGTSSDTVTTASSYNNIYNNQVVGTVNVGIEIGTGHNNNAYNNRVISSGLLPNGTKISAQNVGLSLYDVYGNIANGSMYSDNMYNNTVGWMCWSSNCAWDGYRNDEWFPLDASLYGNNTSISTNPIPYSMETAEYQTWLGKISTNSLTVGPTTSSGNSNSSGGGSSSSSGSSSGISTTAWYTIVNTNSTLCLGAASAGTTAGTKLQQNTCGNPAQAAQEWQFQPTDSGYYKVVNRNALNSGITLLWDVTGGPWETANQVPVQIYTWANQTNQQWMPVALGDGAYKFVARNSQKCLDVPDASSAPLLQLQQYTCNGTGAQSYTLHQQ